MAEYDHVPGLLTQLERTPRKLPKLTIAPSITSLDDLQPLLEADTRDRDEALRAQAGTSAVSGDPLQGRGLRSGLPMRGMIAAVSPEGVIGLGGAIPWRHPGDMRRFARVTRGGTVVHGAADLGVDESPPPPHRRNIVITRGNVGEGGALP